MPRFTVFDLTEKIKNASDASDREMYEDQLHNVGGAPSPETGGSNPDEDFDLDDLA